MKRIFLLLLLIFVAILHADQVKRKKIVITGFDNPKAAQSLCTELSEDYYIKTVSRDYGLDLAVEELNVGYMIVLRGFDNEELLNVIINKLKKQYPKAYMKKYYVDTPGLPKYALGPMPKKNAQVKPVADPEPPVVQNVVETPVKKVAEKIRVVEKKVEAEKPKDYSQYLRKNAVAEEEKNPLYFFVIVGVILFSLVVFIMLKRRRKDDSPDNLDSILLHEITSEVPSQSGGSYEALKVDIHSHLIAGIDDGSQSIEESVRLVQRLKSLGYTKLITTPHIMMHRYPNSTESILKGFKELKIALLKNQITIEIEVASEYYLDEHLMELVEKRDILTFGDNYLLFEMSYVNHPVDFEAMISKMTEAGYKPVLAHPERYLYLGNNFSKYVTLRVLGVYFQVNINSLGGYYSPEVQKNAQRLVNEGMVSFLGSDTHKLRHLETLELVLDSEEYHDVFRKNIILNNTL
jgi:tyrosine-protein phosphatase YwqE